VKLSKALLYAVGGYAAWTAYRAYAVPDGIGYGSSFLAKFLSLSGQPTLTPAAAKQRALVAAQNFNAQGV
jgi:hypothetical protein